MHDDGLVLHERTASFIIAPDALGLRVRRCAAEYAPEHLQRVVDPPRLVNGRHPIALDTRDKQDHKNPLASPAEDGAASLGLQATGGT